LNKPYSFPTILRQHGVTNEGAKRKKGCKSDAFEGFLINKLFKNLFIGYEFIEISLGSWSFGVEEISPSGNIKLSTVTHQNGKIDDQIFVLSIVTQRTTKLDLW